MRIAQIAPLASRVPPIAYGGTELVVSVLTEELMRRGHDVTLFASGDSVTAARLQSVCPRYLRGSDRDKGIWNMLNVVSCLEQAERFDIIHNHSEFEGLSMAGLVKTPVLTTLHGPLKGDWLALFAAYKGYCNTISNSAKALLPEKEGFVGVIYNAIDCKSYPFQEKQGEHLLFLSRISREKGTHIAIEVAKRLKRRLIIAGNVDTVDEEYFERKVMPQVDGDIVQYFGEVNYEQKRELFANALCLLVPITWPEPFGLVMVEAMACGTPVIAFNRGSVPEVVLHGETGFIVQDADEMVAVVGELDRIDRKACREHVARNFNVPRMVDEYLNVYDWILEKEAEKRAIPMLVHSLDQTVPHQNNPILDEYGQPPLSKN
jgi:glycosyltransferase involved in cell wall biosynthesis